MCQMSIATHADLQTSMTYNPYLKLIMYLPIVSICSCLFVIYFMAAAQVACRPLMQP